MLSFRRPALGLLVLLTLWPSVVLGQGQRAGVVTILEGQATVKRVALPDPIPLKFKDDVFVQDRVETGEKSLVRLLLGGAALVTIRARSVATITEIPGKSTVNLDAGKVSVAVARDRLRPGDSLEIRTVNAVAAIRGTVVVAEVNRASPDASGSARPVVTTNFHVLRGTITAVSVDPTTGTPLTAPQPVSGGQSFNVAGTAAPTIGPNPPVEVVTSGLMPGRPQHSQAANGSELSAQAVDAARLLVQALIGPVSQGPSVLALPTTPETLIQPEAVTLQSLPKLLPGGGDLSGLVIPPAQPTAALTNPATPSPGGGVVTPATPAAVPPAPAGPFSPLPGLFASAAMGPFVQPPPGPVFVLPPSAGALQITGAAIEVPSGDILTLDRQLLSITDRVVSAGSLLSVPGSLTSTTTGVLLFVDPSVVSTSGNLLSVAGVLSLKGGFFEDVLGTFNVGGNLLGVTGDLTTTASTALLKLDRTSVTSATDLIRVSGGGTLDLAGPLLDAKNATFALGGRLVVAEGHEAIVRRASNPPPANTFFVALDFSLGGHLTAGTTQPNAIVARGFATHNYVDPDFGSIVLGTDEPIVHQGGKPMLDVTAARTDLTAPSFDVDVTGSAVFVDTALLDASAPLIGLTGAAMRTSGDVINIFQRARVEREVGSLIHLDRSRLDVVNGNLVGVSGGSLLRTANLLTMANGSRVNILNGALLSVLGNSYASIAGCLVCFTGANNVLTITNSMPATGTLFGFPIAGTVQVGAGATAASVFPGLGVNGNALNVTSGVLVNVGPGSTLKLQ